MTVLSHLGQTPGIETRGDGIAGIRPEHLTGLVDEIQWDGAAALGADAEDGQRETSLAEGAGIRRGIDAVGDQQDTALRDPGVFEQFAGDLQSAFRRLLPSTGIISGLSDASRFSMVRTSSVRGATAWASPA